MKRIIHFLFLIVGFSACAQPTITTSWVPSVGVSYVFADFKPLTLDPGPAGAAQTWDLSTIDTSGPGRLFNYINPSSGTDDSLYPTATQCFNEAGFTNIYYQLNGNVYQMVGFVNPNFTFVTYPDPEDVYHFPITYNTTFSDTTVQLTHSLPPYTDTTASTTSITDTADGYGTLITKAGTFPNVMRMHRAYLERDSTFSNHAITVGTSNKYTWISASYPGVELASITHIFSGGHNGYFGGSAFNIVTTGIKDISAAGIAQWSIAPQPASQTARMLIENNNESKTAHVSIRDIYGNEVAIKEQSLNTGTNEVAINVASLSPGIYLATLEVQGLSSTQKMVVNR